MREIKFRGKRLDNNEWVFGGIWFNNTVGRQTVYIIDGDSDNYDVDANTVGQYTGLKDCNDKDIYDGDIFNTRRYFYPGIAVVEWVDDARFLGFTIENERKIVYVDSEPGVEVVGNIYENPELLEVPQ